MRTIDLLATARVAVLVVAAFAASGQCVAAAKTPAAAAAPASEPEFGGQCAMSLAEGQQVATNCSVKWAAPDGKTYCFGDEDAKQRFLKDPDGNLERAAADGIETSVAAVGGPVSAELIESYARAGAKYWLYGVPMSDDISAYERGIEALVAANAEFAGSP